MYRKVFESYHHGLAPVTFQPVDTMVGGGGVDLTPFDTGSDFLGVIPFTLFAFPFDQSNADAKILLQSWTESLFVSGVLQPPRRVSVIESESCSFSLTGCVVEERWGWFEVSSDFLCLGFTNVFLSFFWSLEAASRSSIYNRKGVTLCLIHDPEWCTPTGILKVSRSLSRTAAWPAKTAKKKKNQKQLGGVANCLPIFICVSRWLLEDCQTVVSRRWIMKVVSVWR